MFIGNFTVPFIIKYTILTITGTCLKDMVLVDVSLLQDSYHVNMTGVRVIALCPAATETGFIQDVKKQLLSSEYEKAWQRDTANSVPQK